MTELIEGSLSFTTHFTISSFLKKWRQIVMNLNVAIPNVHIEEIPVFKQAESVHTQLGSYYIQTKIDSTGALDKEI